MTTTTKHEWRELALDLANVAAELATVAHAAGAEGGGWRMDPLIAGALVNHSTAVLDIVKRVTEANQ